MAARRCSHPHKVTGVIHCDLSRTDGRSSVYSAHFNVNICADCGHTDIFCEPHKAACEWLENKTQSSKRRTVRVH